MTTHIFYLKEFKFPADLSGIYANFRFLVEFRYIDDDTKNLCTHTVIMPGLDSYFECDEEERDESNNVALYVRKERIEGEEQSMFAMGNEKNQVNDWVKLISGFRAKKLIQMRFTVFDVDRKNWYEKLAGYSDKIDFSGIPGIVPAAVGTVAELILKLALEHIAEITDRGIWRGVYDANDEDPGEEITIACDNTFSLKKKYWEEKYENSQEFSDEFQVKVSHKEIV